VSPDCEVVCAGETCRTRTDYGNLLAVVEILLRYELLLGVEFIVGDEFLDLVDSDR